MDLSVRIGTTTWPTPIGLASGTCGYGKELEERVEIDWNAVGAIFTKGLSLAPRPGNPPNWLGDLPGRMTEVEFGAVNSIGLENVGVEAFVTDKMPYLREWRTRHGGRVIANIFGEKVEEYVALAERLDNVEGIDGLELNLSCPNVSCGGIEFGRNAADCARVTEAVRRVTRKLLIVKLSPVCTVEDVAPAAEAAGADALSISNTLPALVVDVARQARAPGGLSGPALRPVAVHMTYQARRVTSIPIIGIGGIACASHALEFLLAGATAVQVGTALFANPNVAATIRQGIIEYLGSRGQTSILDIVGAIHVRDLV